MDYKPHPFEELTTARSSLLKRLGVTVVESDAPGEYLALSYGAVSGVLSSALVNLCALGWHDAVFGVLDARALADLSARTIAEMEQVLCSGIASGHTAGSDAAWAVLECCL